jgi:hypothetical protein
MAALKSTTFARKTLHFRQGEVHSGASARSGDMKKARQPAGL